MSSSGHASSAETVEPQLRQTDLQGRKPDYSCDTAHAIPPPERQPKLLTGGTSQGKRFLRRKENCRNLRAKAASQDAIKEFSEIVLPLFDGSGSHADNISLPQQKRDQSSGLMPGPPEREIDPKDGRRTRRGHRATERPIPSSPALNGPTSSPPRLEPILDLDIDFHSAHQVSGSSHNRQDAHATSQSRVQDAGFITSEDWQQHPTSFGHGSPYEAIPTRDRREEHLRSTVHTGQGPDSDASTLVAEKRFNPIAGLEGFNGVPTIRGQGYYYPPILRPFPRVTFEDIPNEGAAFKGIPFGNTLAEETLLHKGPAHIPSADDIASTRHGHLVSASLPLAGSRNRDAERQELREVAFDLTPIPAFEKYSIPSFSWQPDSPRMTEGTSIGLRQLMVSLYESLYEIDWYLAKGRS